MGANSAPFVLATVGTDHHPFNRFVEWIDQWHDQNPHVDLFVQRGTCDRVPAAPSTQWLEPRELDDMMHRADAIVCHGGPSTIMEARDVGVVPVVVPRNPALGEHVDEHQMRFASFMADKGAILCAQSQPELGAHLQTVTANGVERATATDPTATLHSISSVVDDLMSRRCRPIFGTGRLS